MAVFLLSSLFSSNESHSSKFISENKGAVVLTGMGTALLGAAGLLRRPIFTGRIFKKLGEFSSGIFLIGGISFIGGLTKFWRDWKKNNSTVIEPKKEDKVDEPKLEEEKQPIQLNKAKPKKGKNDLISITFFIKDKYEQSLLEPLMMRSVEKIKQYLGLESKVWKNPIIFFKKLLRGKVEVKWNNFDLWLIKLLKNQFDPEEIKERRIKFNVFFVLEEKQNTISTYAADYVYSVFIAGPEKLTDSLPFQDAINLKIAEDKKLEEEKNKYSLLSADGHYLCYDYNSRSEEKILPLLSCIDVSDLVNEIIGVGNLNRDALSQTKTSLHRHDGDRLIVPEISVAPEQIEKLFKIIN